MERKNFEFGKCPSPEEMFKDYKKQFAQMTDCELVEAFNREVGNPGWGSARGAYLAALHREFQERGFDISAIGNDCSMSLKNKVKLEYVPTLKPVSVNNK